MESHSVRLGRLRGSFVRFRPLWVRDDGIYDVLSSHKISMAQPTFEKGCRLRGAVFVPPCVRLPVYGAPHSVRLCRLRGYFERFGPLCAVRDDGSARSLMTYCPRITSPWPSLGLKGSASVQHAPAFRPSIITSGRGIVGKVP